MTNVDPKYQRRKEAIEGALDVLVPEARYVILTYLNCQKKIAIGSDYCSPIEQIEECLEELFGDGAALIMYSVAARELR